MGMENYLASTSDYSSVVSINLFVALLCACIVIGHLLEESRWMNESITALIVGLATGVVILLLSRGKSSHLLLFSEDLFFIYLLPPIIFNAGFQVKKKQFFRNFITIMLFGAVGTLVSWAVISFGVTELFSGLDFFADFDIGDYLAIGAMFSATDSVCTLQVLNQDETPLLYSLVFGEGVVNDATSVVLFNAIQSFDLSKISPSIALHFVGNFLYLFFASTALGVVAGLLCAYIIKKLYFGRHSTDREVSLMMLMAYLSYMLAELLDLSGILTVFFCGIVMSHYTWHNVTESSRITTKHAFATLSYVAETFIFLYVGMDALDIEKWRFVSDSPGKSAAVSSILFGLVLLGRAAFVFPISFLSNLTKKSANEKITLRQQVIIWWAGLIRGAVSIALAYNKVNLQDTFCYYLFTFLIGFVVRVYHKTKRTERYLESMLFENNKLFFCYYAGWQIFLYRLSFLKEFFLRNGCIWQFTTSGHTHVRSNAFMITSTITIVLFSTVVTNLFPL
ncbi:OLC1v1000684C2 [Oldenlandia corymbosa var. corymbosa]|uniref:OLC1v1000684C2 n=1 Tax=Oldenlandia corymbosa var. corymbosa TaxID=529605 RepID=A0AAV1D684_OLDCO|nr:OLC1v1000684C2 [Oldenlandia corymbosa var. corymbosa]